LAPAPRRPSSSASSSQRARPTKRSASRSSSGGSNWRWAEVERGGTQAVSWSGSSPRARIAAVRPSRPSC